MRHLCKIMITMSVICLTLVTTGCGINAMAQHTDKTPEEEELLKNFPEMDVSTFNQFLFTMNVTAGITDGNSEKITMSGAVETYHNISHIYNVNITTSESKYKAETWTDYEDKKRYIDLGQGFTMGDVINNHAVKDLSNLINNRDCEMIMVNDSSASTLSWIFPTDNNYLFDDIMEPYTDNKNLKGYGRITAVFDPKTYEFQCFTIVISVNNEDKAYAILDAVFYWDEKNNKENGLQIPEEIKNNIEDASVDASLSVS